MAASAWGVRTPPLPLLARSKVETQSRKDNYLPFSGANPREFPSLREGRSSLIFSCRCTVDDGAKISYKDWDWNRWNRHFSEIDEAENFLSVLKVISVLFTGEVYFVSYGVEF